MAVTLSGCTAAPEASAVDASEFGHVHGIGVNRSDGATYVATHTGVWRLDSAYLNRKPSTIPPKQVGPRQDTMGFAVTGERLMYASGHPAPGEQVELKLPNLGLIHSVDGATSWKTVSLRGQVDFHDLAAVLTPAGMHRIYGYDAARRIVMVSDDDGSRWEDRATVDLRDLAVNESDPDVLYATTSTGLLVSRDRGRSFGSVPGAPQLLLIDSINGSPGGFVGVDTGGTVWMTNNGGGSWQSHGRTRGVPQALTHVSHGSTSWILAADDRGVVASPDYGKTWSVLATERP